MSKEYIAELVNGDTYILRRNDGDSLTFRQGEPVAVDKDTAQYLKSIADFKTFSESGERFAVKKFAIQHAGSEEDALSVENERKASLRAEEQEEEDSRVDGTLEAQPSYTIKGKPGKTPKIENNQDAKEEAEANTEAEATQPKLGASNKTTK